MTGFVDTANSLGLTGSDLLVLAFIALVLMEELVSLPRFRRRLRLAQPGTKRPLYLVAAAKLWLLASVVLTVWMVEGRGLPSLGLSLSEEGWRGYASWAAVAGVVAFFGWQLGGLLFSPEMRETYRRRVAEAGESLRFMPDTTGEHRAFCFLGLTAGITEEIVFRGYLIWAFSQFLDLPVAALIAVLIFGLFHIYQGTTGFIASVLAGGVMTCLYLVSGSLLPAIVLHALIDLLNAQSSFVAKRDLGFNGRRGETA
jgi:membrane protease YdiL (CAAX protease family)